MIHDIVMGELRGGYGSVLSIGIDRHNLYVLQYIVNVLTLSCFALRCHSSARIYFCNKLDITDMIHEFDLFILLCVCSLGA